MAESERKVTNIDNVIDSVNLVSGLSRAKGWPYKYISIKLANGYEIPLFQDVNKPIMYMIETLIREDQEGKK